MNRGRRHPYTDPVDEPRSDSGGRRAADVAFLPVGRIRTQPTQQGVVYLWTIAIFSGVLWWQGENLVFLLGSLALGCGCVAWFLARRNLRGLALARTLPDRSRVGAPTPLAWTLRSGGGRTAIGIALEDRPVKGLRPLCLQVDLPVVPASEIAACETQVTFARRGRLDVGAEPIRLSSRFPLGLFQAEAQLYLRGKILVRPREGRVTERLRGLLRGCARADASRVRLRAGDDVIYGVREYREGDDPRRIHWRSTARRGSTVVSEWRAEQGHETVIVLGLGQGAGRGAAAAFERAVSCAATIWRACAREQLRTRLVLGGVRDPELGGSVHGVEEGLDALALLSARGKRKPRRVLQRLARNRSARRTVLYIGTGPERGLEGELQAAAGRGGTSTHLRADLRSVLRWVQGVEK